ncbi:flagellar hook-associated protein FlgK [Gracilibacillus xinjiangensis]|uniref:Flagellar hook-associated protein 1 n=1 Tax=Gracilibacillus xinjiangensis TaxID=1193282 RepID=A0ABV8WX76_9BACI
MASTFNGLEVAKRALHAQQSALYTTGHNISNANTEGYTRQRVNFAQTSPYPPASRNRPEIAGQVGSGVAAGSIERIRDSFIDKQYRQENTKVGYYEAKADMMSKLESILNEPTDQGLSETFDLFWKSIQDLSTNPEDAGTRSVVKERGIAVAEAFRYIESSLQGVRENYAIEIGVEGTEINSTIDQINQLNGQIAKIEPHGYVPNDLYDQRDLLIDELSQYVDIELSYKKSSGQPSPIAEGLVSIELKGEGITLVDGTGNSGQVGSDQAVNHIFADFDDDHNLETLYFANPDRNIKPEDQLQNLSDGTLTATASIAGNEYDVQGKLKAMIDGSGYLDGGEPAGEINEFLADLDKMVANFVEEFNSVHRSGYGLNNTTGVVFFNGTSAATITVNEDIIKDPELIAASTEEFDEDGNSTGGSTGNGENAIKLTEVYTKRYEQFSEDGKAAIEDLSAELKDKQSIKGFYESVIGEMGVVAEESMRMQNNSAILRQQVNESRQAISSVSLDEEMTNLIQFQHAYNAAARNMTVVDEMLDRIINNMGLVGR